MLTKPSRAPRNPGYGIAVCPRMSIFILVFQESILAAESEVFRARLVQFVVGSISEPGVEPEGKAGGKATSKQCSAWQLGVSRMKDYVTSKSSPRESLQLDVATGCKSETQNSCLNIPSCRSAGNEHQVAKLKIDIQTDR